MRVAVLTIGSLFWERHRWQPDALDFEAATPLAVPIRYGRQSASRDDGYTMVVSLSSPPGSARLVPFRARATDFDELLRFAQIVGDAEGYQGELFTAWGCVAMLAEPDGEVVARWRQALAGRAAPILSAYREEDAPCDPAGLLHPSLWSRELAERVDVVFATVTKPVAIQPTAAEIVAAMGAPPEGNRAYQYFRSNVMAGITTYQDREITAALRGRGFMPD